MRTIEQIEKDIKYWEKEIEDHQWRLTNIKNELRKAKEANQLKAEHGDVFTNGTTLYFVRKQDGKFYIDWENHVCKCAEPEDHINKMYESNTWKFQYNVFNPDKKKVGC